MTHFAKILLAHSKERRAIKFGIAANIIIGVRMEFFAVPIAPLFFGIVFRFRHYSFGAPIVFFARQKSAAFEEQNAFAGWRQRISEGASAGPRPDNNYVIMVFICHGSY